MKGLAPLAPARGEGFAYNVQSGDVKEELERPSSSPTQDLQDPNPLLPIQPWLPEKAVGQP